MPTYEELGLGRGAVVDREDSRAVFGQVMGLVAVTVGFLALGAYLGALEQVQTPAIRLPLAQISANEAQQQSALAHVLGRGAIGSAFAAALPIDVVSAALDGYES